ncbi:hypothetical protein ACFSKI_05365 [Pseudogracilibacillus auburnensis]|uniref:WXG superfamily protein probably secreted by type VII secretion system n=1 Tax=Pseudogracilibacillus auburnensis TaxID=1494959 RepID=A0A2V3WC84_9BACI|nr:hypothetical protein [Pseudogracilibacillus auburnensis]PXW86349.1 hypothetical protein DFR56_108168 [Pseudogracilibacillus auburnensis]
MEHSIQSMRSVQLGLPVANLEIAGVITTLRLMQSKMKEKLQKLIDFNGNSTLIFSNIEQLLSSVETGLREVSSGRAWNSSTFNSSKLDMDWAKDITTKKFYADLDKAISMGEKLGEADILKLFTTAKENPDVEVPPSVFSYVKENIPNILFGLSGTIFSESYKSLGKELIETGEVALKKFGKEGKIQFKDFPLLNKLVDKDFLNNINKLFDKGGNYFIRQGNNLLRVGTALGTSFTAIGLAVGMQDDLVNEDKTVGEAIAHNVIVSGVGVGASLGAGALLGTNPVGWGIVGVAAVGMLFSLSVDWAYQNNILGFQGLVDSVGEAIQHNIIENPIIIGGPFPLYYMDTIELE